MALFERLGTPRPGDTGPCSVCGWTTVKQRCCSYKSTVKLFYGASEHGAWSIGSDLIMKERPASEPALLEAKTMGFVDAHTSMPIPKVAKA